ncbi:ATP-binding cassette domain-containing protein [Arthrobacter sp. MYb221]|uniref:ATP-binding cassette domain-containing protein n=1 Tax=unclassified Arthrobacter TaxID=235627 RepID=UPI0035BE6DB7
MEVGGWDIEIRPEFLRLVGYTPIGSNTRSNRTRIHLCSSIPGPSRSWVPADCSTNPLISGCFTRIPCQFSTTHLRSQNLNNQCAIFFSAAHEIQMTGTGVSGGHRTRIAIARVLLRNPKILLIDTATPNLDLEADQIIMNLLVEPSIRRELIRAGRTSGRCGTRRCGRA